MDKPLDTGSALTKPLKGQASLDGTTGKAKGINSILNGFGLLRALVENGAMGLKELSHRAGLSAAQAHAYLISLKQVNVVEQDEASGRYQLGQFALVLGLARLRSIEPLERVFDRAAILARETDSMVIVSVFSTAAPVVVRVLNPPRDFLVASRVGHVPSMIDTCTGRVFAAFMPKDEIDPILATEFASQDQKGFPTHYTFETLGEEIERIRRQGYAGVTGSPNRFLSSLSAPIFNGFGQLECVLTITAAAKHISLAPDGADVRRLIDVTASLSAELGHGLLPVEDDQDRAGSTEKKKLTSTKVRS
ncbi:IclR family transcriptional regulator [Bosea thiooxidans]